MMYCCDICVIFCRFRRQVQVKVITLDGTIVAKNGNMTGGFGGDDALKASKWDDKEFRAAQVKRDELLAVCAVFQTHNKGVLL